MSLFSSCRLSEFTSILFAAQAWSQNYALIEGVTCSAREMIDGDIKTVGSSGHQIRINLPERKTVHRLVFRQTNIQDLTLYIDRNNDDENDWMKWEQIDSNRESTFEIRKVFNAQRIRILIGATSDRFAGCYLCLDWSTSGGSASGRWMARTTFRGARKSSSISTGPSAIRRCRLQNERQLSELHLAHSELFANDCAGYCLTFLELEFAFSKSKPVAFWCRPNMFSYVPKGCTLAEFCSEYLAAPVGEICFRDV